ncbi:TetR/AcrR family transcriptional regulator [Ponticaulis sp.]|uniref:TetR/AcrR family transcriptional regulator n=1 Tax=Ponticaulis sp. TaxID=2020902 RepID=UPI002634CC17|nr:TetR/AcrR family transcriptional regulator [Ponticaulis sp.]MDF1681622.1 TetR/AcrR family transcriptional regulator [Ponticaulis sp.]
MPTQTRTRNAKPKIERAAIELFISEGIDAATTRQIAERAGVSEGALYRHYKGKEELAEALFMQLHDRLSRLLIEAALAGNDLKSRVGAIVGAYCELADEDWEYCCYHLLFLNRFIKNDVRREDDPVSLTEAMIADLMENGHIPKGDPEILSAMCLGVITQAGQNKPYNRLKGPFSQYKDDIAAAIMAILKYRLSDFD